MAYVQLPNQNRLSGLNTLAYMGTEATTPPQFVVEKRDPTINDYQGWLLGTVWLQEHTQRVWMLVDKQYLDPISGNRWPARWVMINGDEGNEFDTDNGIAYPRNGILNVLGGANMRTEAIFPAQDTITVNVIDHPVFPVGLSVTALAAPGVVTTDATGLFNSTNGTDGQIIVARGVGPVWADVFSSDGTVIIAASVDPLHPNGINLRAVGGGGGAGTVTSFLCDDANTVTPVLPAGTITITGSNFIQTVGAVANTIQIDVGDSDALGDLIIGAGPGLPSTWGRLYSSNASVVITPGVDPLDPAKNAINLTVAGGAGAFAGLKDTAGTIAVPDIANTVQLSAALPLTAVTAGSVINLGISAPAADGQILISSAIGVPTWANIVGAGGITVTNNHNSITLTGGGGGGGMGFNTINCDSDVAFDAGGHVLSLLGVAAVGGYDNIQTRGNGAQQVTIELNNYIRLPSTNAGGTAGLIKINNHDFMHAYGTGNTFLGENAGNRTFTAATAVGNTYIGTTSGRTTVRASQNVAVGYQTLLQIETGPGGGSVPDANCKRNTVIGYQAGYSFEKANDTIAIGYRAGRGVVSNSDTNILIGTEGYAGDAHKIRIGTNGVHTTAHMAGVWGVATPNSSRLVTVTGTGITGAKDQLAALPAAGVAGKNLKSTATNYIWSTGAATYLFNAYPQDTTNVTGDGTVYWLGAENTKPLILVKNIGGGNYFLGSAGIRAFYEIPEAGTYLVAMEIRFNGLRAPFIIPPPPPPPVTVIDPMVIAVRRGPGIVKQWAHYPPLIYDGHTGHVSAFFSVMYEFAALDKIEWYIQCDYRPGESIAGAWPLTYNQQSKTIGIDTISGDLQFSQVSVTNLTDL